ncbi:MAG: peptidase T [Lachnospiraceae bacterium]|nr:peptidase T [Lachnospiraceae bacterium]
MKAYERFLNYIKINTRSDETSGTHPSFCGQFDLANMLVCELSDMGLEAEVDKECYVYSCLPATPGCEDLPVLGFISHMDTSPAFSGQNVKAVIHRNYDGKDVVYPSGAVMKAADFPFLSGLKGETLITSDGTTLLGADDKAGISEIMTALNNVIKDGRPHGKIAVAFTPDEEIGEGADSFDVKRFGADYAYTVDGSDVHIIEYENFNAASAKVEICGVSVHPGTAKDVMVNAVNVAHELHGLLPEKMRPEHTSGREGFFHLTDIEGSVDHAKLSYIIRDHDREKFENMKKMIDDAVTSINKKYGKDTAVLTVTDSYYNMIEMIRPHMHLIESAKNAIRSAGMEPEEMPIRGGTDGARLSFMGLPCPNLGTGGFNFHGPFECITVERMEKAVSVIETLMCQLSAV